MMSNSLMIVDVARIFPLSPKTIISNSGTTELNSVLELRDLNWAYKERIKDERDKPVTAIMVASMTDLNAYPAKGRKMVRPYLRT